MNIELDHSVIHVSDWQQSRLFYEQVLGAEAIAMDQGFTFRFGNAQLNCHGPGKKVSELAKIPVQPGGSDLCFVWPGPISDAVEHLAKHKVEVEVGPVARFGKNGTGTSVYFRDPDGSLMEFISYVD